MTKRLLCNNPPIEDSLINQRVINVLFRNCYAMTDRKGRYEIDWEGLNAHCKDGDFRKLRGVGDSFNNIIRTWMKLVVKSTQWTETRKRKVIYFSNHHGSVLRRHINNSSLIITKKGTK